MRASRIERGRDPELVTSNNDGAWTSRLNKLNEIFIEKQIMQDSDFLLLVCFTNTIKQNYQVQDAK